MSECNCPQSQYIYSASAYGFSGELERPTRQTIGTQAASVLGADGGHGSSRIQNFKFDSFISVADAHTEVGGSYDECHGIHTTYAFSSLEGLNIADMLTADRVVSRLYIYSPGVGSNPGTSVAVPAKAASAAGKLGDGSKSAPSNEPSFTIAGSHFVNLRIAGFKADVQLATSEFHEFDTHTKIGQAGKWLLASQLAEKSDEQLKNLEHTYHALRGISRLARAWRQRDEQGERVGEGEKSHHHCPTFLFSLVKSITLEGHEGPDIQILGNMVCIPKFGVIRLADLLVHGHDRNLTMFRVQMCSGAAGSGSGGGTMGGGGSGT